MRYPKGKNEGKIISIHLQKKAMDFINHGLYKKGSSIADLEEENNRLRNEIRKLKREKENLIKKTQSLGASNQHLKNQIRSLFKINKREYSPQMVWL